LKKFDAGLSERGVKLVVGYVDDRSSLSGLGLASQKRITPASVKGYLDALREKVSRRSRAPASILILGGHGVIPYFKLANPAFDSDKEVLSDNPYGSRPGALSSEKCLLPDVPVGRMPDGDGCGVELLLGQMDLAARAGKPRAGGKADGKGSGLKSGRPRPGSAGGEFGRRDAARSAAFAGLATRAPEADSLKYTAAVWQKASREVVTGLGWKGVLRVSPPLTYLGVKASWFEGKTFLYFNLHGSDREPYWFGQKGDKYPTALSPGNVTNLNRGSNAVLTEACYGAIEAGRSRETSIALAFLATGSLCFVGSTCVAYGALVPPVSEADLIALNFFRNVQKGMAFGKALVNARAQLAGLAVSRQGYLDEDDKKTLLQFVLFGDPTLRLPSGV